MTGHITQIRRLNLIPCGKRITEKQIKTALLHIARTGNIPPLHVGRDYRILSGEVYYEAARRLHLRTLPCLMEAEI